MRVLVATTQTQGDKANDYCCTVEGELVRLPGPPCANPHCGCAWGWAGLASSRATSTCRVADLRLDPAEVFAAFSASLVREGWVQPGAPVNWIADLVAVHIEIAESFPVGTVLGILNGEVFDRGWVVA